MPTAAPRLHRYVLLLGVMVTLSAFSTDMYLPSLPRVASDLHTSNAAAQLTLTAMLIGAAAGQLIVGPLSDRFGRRRPALIGAAAHVITSLLCFVAPSINILIGLRIMQGFFNASVGVVAMAVVRDRFSGATAARLLSRLMLVIGAAPLFAPTIGSAIAHLSGWRAVFVALALYGVVLWLVMHRWLPDSLAVENRRPGGMRTALRGYRELIADKKFLSLAVVPGLIQAMLMSYVVASPFVLEADYGLTQTQFTMVFASNGVLLVVGAQINASLVRTITPVRILRVVLPVGMTLVSTLAVLLFTRWGGLPLLLINLGLLLMLTNSAQTIPSALALSRHGEMAGTAAAVIGFVQSGTAGVVSSIVGFMTIVLGSSGKAMGVVMVSAYAIAILVVAVGTPIWRMARNRAPEAVASVV